MQKTWKQKLCSWRTHTSFNCRLKSLLFDLVSASKTHTDTTIRTKANNLTWMMRSIALFTSLQVLQHINQQCWHFSTKHYTNISVFTALVHQHTGINSKLTFTNRYEFWLSLLKRFARISNAIFWMSSGSVPARRSRTETKSAFNVIGKLLAIIGTSKSSNIKMKTNDELFDISGLRWTNWSLKHHSYGWCQMAIAQHTDSDRKSSTSFAYTTPFGVSLALTNDTHK